MPEKIKRPRVKLSPKGLFTFKENEDGNYDVFKKGNWLRVAVLSPELTEYRFIDATASLTAFQLKDLADMASLIEREYEETT